MDSKQRALLVELHTRIVAGNFGETDIHSLLILLRDESPRDGAIRELADFVAHRRRDRGPIHGYMREIKRLVDAPGDRDFAVKRVFTECEIGAASTRRSQPTDWSRSPGYGRDRYSWRSSRCCKVSQCQMGGKGSAFLNSG